MNLDCYTSASLASFALLSCCQTSGDCKSGSSSASSESNGLETEQPEREGEGEGEKCELIIICEVQDTSENLRSALRNLRGDPYPLALHSDSSRRDVPWTIVEFEVQVQCVSHIRG